MLTFLAETNKPVNLDVEATLQEIRSYSVQQTSAIEKDVSFADGEGTNIEDIYSQFSDLRLSALKRRTTLAKMKNYREQFEKTEWILHACRPGQDNIWRQFLRDVGHEYISSTRASKESLQEVATPKEGLTTEVLESLPKLSELAHKEERDDTEPQTDRTLQDDTLMTTLERSTNVTADEASKGYADWVRTFNPPVEQKMLTIFDLTKSLYFGEWSRLNMHGYGSYVLSLGTRYSGELKEGMFYGNGVLFYPYGSRIEGEWIKGVLNPKKRKYVFHDGLVFKEHNWGYLRGHDHRFYSEVVHGLLPGCEFKMTNSGVQHCIPIGWYDVAEGYFNPRTKAIMSYDTEELLLGDGTTHDIHKLIRICKREETKWIMENCRREEDKIVGFQENIFKFCYESEPVKEEEEEEEEEEEILEETEVPKTFHSRRITRETKQSRRTMLDSIGLESEEENEFEQCVQMLIPNSDVRRALLSEDDLDSYDPIPKDISKEMLKLLEASFQSHSTCSHDFTSWDL